MAKFQIFKAGVPVTSMEGAAVQFSAADLQGIAQRYDPALHEAPLIVGHPAHDAPAYGWVKGLSFADGALQVEEQQVDPAFDELRKAGRYKKVSARFYTPTAPNNPTPGEYYLRDVGFLGAAAPAVKGLRSCSFADDEQQHVVSVEVSFADLPAWAGGYIATLFRGMRDFLIEKFGKDEADKVMPDYAIQGIADMSTRAEAIGDDLSANSFSEATRNNLSNHASKEKPHMKTAEQLQADLDAATKALAEEKGKREGLEKADRERATAARHTASVSFAEKLVADAKWPSGALDVLVATLDHLSTPIDTGVVSFGEGDAAKPLHEVLCEQLAALPPQVSFGEHVRRGSGGGDAADPTAIAAKAVEYQAEQKAKGVTVNTAEAVAHVSKS